MAYGSRSNYFKKSSGSYRRSRFGGSGVTKVAYRKKTAKYGRRLKGEKKYFDKTYQANSNESVTGQSTPTVVNNGVTYISNTWGNYSFGAHVATANVVSNNMLRGLGNGTSVRTRIGNKVTVNYVKGAFTFTAAATSSVDDQGGETIIGTVAVTRYLRTSFRFVIVKDLQVNSADDVITWAQVFDTTNQQAGVHSELNVDNMGRFIVLQDKIFTVDADTPQKTCPFLVSGGKLGSVRYNGTTGTAATDKGIYVVWAAFVMGYIPTSGAAIELPSPVGHSRFCFTDE